MKWGIRRTPEQLGHKPVSAKKSSYQKYKLKKLKKIDKMYRKPFAELEEARAIDPNNKRLKDYANHLNQLYERDKKRVADMSFVDVQNEKRANAKKTRETVLKVAGTTASVAGSTALWGLRIGLNGVRIYGIFKAANLLGSWLATENGLRTINDIKNMANNYVKTGDNFIAKNSDLLKNLSSKYLGVDPKMFDMGKAIATRDNGALQDMLWETGININLKGDKLTTANVIDSVIDYSKDLAVKSINDQTGININL